MHVSVESRQVQSNPVQPGLHRHLPHSQTPFSGPPHNKPWYRSHEKLSHSQYLPEIISSRFVRLSHSQTPQMHCPRPLQSVNVVLSGRQPRSRSDSLCASRLHCLREKKEKKIKRNSMTQKHFPNNQSILHWAFTFASEMIFITFAQTAFVCAVSFASGWKWLISWMIGLFTCTTAQHCQVDDQTFVDANRVDLERLNPVAWIRWTLGNNDFGWKTNHISHTKAITFWCRNWWSLSLARWIVSDFYVICRIVFHFNGRRNFLQISKFRILFVCFWNILILNGMPWNAPCIVL